MKTRRAKRQEQIVTLRPRCKFSIADDDSNGPTGPDYLLLQLRPSKAGLKRNPFLRDLDLSIYFKTRVRLATANAIKRLLDKNSLWLQYRYLE